MSDAIGLEILDVDLRERLAPARVVQLREAWHDGLIVLLRDQTLTEDDQVRFAEYFGPLGKTLNVHNTGRHPAIMLVSNIREDGKPIGALPDGEMQFHTDQCYVERPAAASMLYAIEVPPYGGDTLFANQYQAYDTLSDGMKKMLSGLRALHSDRKVAGPRANMNAQRATKVREDADWRETISVHPVVRTHPETGRKCLYVNRGFTVRFKDMTQQRAARCSTTCLPIAPNPNLPAVSAGRRARLPSGITVAPCITPSTIITAIAA